MVIFSYAILLAMVSLIFPPAWTPVPYLCVMRKEAAGGIISVAVTLSLVLIWQDIHTRIVVLSLLADIVLAAIFARERNTRGILRQFLVYIIVTIVTLMIATVLMFIYFIIFFKKPGG